MVMPLTQNKVENELTPDLQRKHGVLKLVLLCQIWDFYGYSLNTLKYPKMGIRYFFLCFGVEFPI